LRLLAGRTRSDIYHGDSMEILPDHRRRVRPPGLHRPALRHRRGQQRGARSKSGGWQDMMNSAGWFTSWYREVDRVAQDHRLVLVVLNWRTLPVVMRAAVDAGLPITSLAVWDKEWIGPGGVQGLRPSYELIALLAQPEFAIPDRGVADVFRHKVGSYKPNGHPAEKPVPIVRRVMEVAAVPSGGLVVDPFMGSGTAPFWPPGSRTRFIGIEAEEKWCEVAASRLAQGDLAIEAAVIERRLGPAADNGRWTPAKEQITRMREAAQGDTKSHRSFAGEARRHARDAAGMQGLTRWQWENER
jgi:hypothetical protein